MNGPFEGHWVDAQLLAVHRGADPTGGADQYVAVVVNSSTIQSGLERSFLRVRRSP